MISEFQLALIIGALVTAIIARKLPHSWLWISAWALSFVASTAYFRLGLPYYPIATLFFDGCLSIAIYGKARERWELLLMRLVQCSILISLVYSYLLFFQKTVAHHWLYIVLLETVNWAALALILGTAALDRIRANGDSSAHHWVSGLYRHLNPLRSSRTSVPWHKIPR